MGWTRGGDHGGARNMRVFVPLLTAGLFFACSPQRAKTDLPADSPPGDDTLASRVASCDGLEGVACFERRRANCSEAWRFRAPTLSAEVFVTDAGVARMDMMGRSLFGVDAELWLACFPACPGTNLERLCIPYHVPTSFSFNTDETCSTSTKSGEPWEGWPSQITSVKCENGSHGQLRHIPSLVGVRDALVAVQVIDPDDELAKLDGFTVEMSLGGETLFSFEDLGRADCSVFEYPADYEVYGRPSHFREFREILPRLNSELHVHGERLLNEMLQRMLGEIEHLVMDRLGRLCLGERDTYEAKEVEECFESKPELVREAEGIVGELTGPLIAAVRREVEGGQGEAGQLVERYIDAPLCEHFAGTEDRTPAPGP
jgi:hypothetical protein